MDPSLLVLEGLQKDVAAGSISIPGACFKLQGIIQEVVKDDSRQFFRQLFPRLLHFIIGSKSGPYLLDVLGLLVTPLCSGLLELVKDRNGALEVYRLLEPKGDLFLSMLHMQSIDPTTRFDVPVSEFAVASVGDTAVSETKARLDYCELFYFYLIKAVSTVLPSIPVQTSHPATSTRPVVEIYRRFVSLGIGIPHVMDERACRWNHDLVAETYLTILEGHLEYALPTASGKESVFTNGDFKSKATAAGRVSEALIGLVGQLWLAVNKDSPRLPTLDVLHSLELVVQHTSRSMCEGAFANRYVAQAVENAYSALRLALYPFFRSLLQAWPLDYNFIAMVAVWKAFAAPWSHSAEAAGKDPQYWHPYVMNNFFFYVTIPNLILQHIEASLDALVSVQLKSRLASSHGHEYAKRLLPTVEALRMCLVVMSPVRDLVRQVESSETRTASPYAEFRIQEQLAVLEPASRTIPAAFDSASVNRAMSLIRWLQRAHDCLKQTSMSESPELALDGMIIECMDVLSHHYSIHDPEFNAFVERANAKEKVEAESRLTPRRRNLVCSTPTSKQQLLLDSIRPSSGRPFCNDEIPILMTFFAWLSHQINSLVRAGLLRINSKYPLPPWLLHHQPALDLRCLAVWQNLVFVVAVWCTAWSLYKLIF